MTVYYSKWEGEQPGDYSHTVNLDNNHPNFIYSDIEHWLKENINNDVTIQEFLVLETYIDLRFVFDNNDDAILFKLRWS